MNLLSKGNTSIEEALSKFRPNGDEYLTWDWKTYYRKTRKIFGSVTIVAQWSQSAHVVWSESTSGYL